MKRDRGIRSKDNSMIDLVSMVPHHAEMLQASRENTKNMAEDIHAGQSELSIG